MLRQRVSCLYTGWSSWAKDAHGDAPVEDKYVHVKEPAQMGGTLSVKMDTTVMVAAKPEVAEDACVSPKDPEKHHEQWGHVVALLKELVLHDLGVHCARGSIVPFGTQG